MEHMQCNKGERLLKSVNTGTGCRCGSTIGTLEVLQAQFDQTMNINNDLTDKLELVQSQQKEREVKVLMLEANVYRLQKALRDVKQEKSELYSQTHAILQKGKSLEDEDSFHVSIVQLLKQQLSESEDLLGAERRKFGELETRVSELDEGLNLSKIEVWNLTRYTTELEFQLVATRKEATQTKKDLEAKKATELEMESRILQIEKIIGFKGTIKPLINGIN